MLALAPKQRFSEYINLGRERPKEKTVFMQYWHRDYDAAFHQMLKSPE